MEFIRGSINGAEEQGPTGIAPEPGAETFTKWFTFGAPEEHRQDGVFSQMGALADSNDDIANLFLRKIGEQPVDEWADNPRRMLEGGRVARPAKDEEHPENHWQPVNQENPELEHRG